MIQLLKSGKRMLTVSTIQKAPCHSHTYGTCHVTNCDTLQDRLQENFTACYTHPGKQKQRV